MKLGDRLKLLREKKGLSQMELARRLNMPNHSISNYERGLRRPSFDALTTMADYFEVSVDYLLGRDPQIVTHDGEMLTLERFLDEGKITFQGMPLNQEDVENLTRFLEMMKKYKEKCQ